MKLQRQIAKNRVVLALLVALLMAANAWGASPVQYPTNYIDENGVPAKKNCYLITATDFENHASLSLALYKCVVFNESITFSGRVTSSADLTIILADAANVTINFDSQANNQHALDATGYDIKIYGQKNQTGSLTVNSTTSSYLSRGISAQNIYIYGGHVTATSNARDAIWAQNDIDIYGGYISATGAAGNTYVGIKSETGNINVNWANSLYANSYMISSGKAIKIADGLTLTDGSNEYSGSNPSIAGKTLTPTDYLVQFVTNADNSKRAIINGEYSGEAVNIPQGTEVVSIDYNRTFTAGVPSTVVLPFSLPSGSTINAKFYYLQEVVQKSDACAWKATLKNIGADNLPQANTPYAVLTEEDKLQFNLNDGKATFQAPNDLTTTVSEGKWSFIGVYSYKVWEPGDTELGLAYAFAGSNEAQIAKGKFGKIAIEENSTDYPFAYPFRAYLKKSDSNVKLQCPQAVLGQNSAQYSLGHNSETIDVHFIDEDENGEKTTFMARMNTRTGEFTMLRNFDIKGRKVNAANKVRGAYYGKKVIKQ